MTTTIRYENEFHKKDLSKIEVISIGRIIAPFNSLDNLEYAKKILECKNIQSLYIESYNIEVINFLIKNSKILIDFPNLLKITVNLRFTNGQTLYDTMPLFIGTKNTIYNKYICRCEHNICDECNKIFIKENLIKKKIIICVNFHCTENALFSENCNKFFELYENEIIIYMCWNYKKHVDNFFFSMKNLNINLKKITIITYDDYVNYIEEKFKKIKIPFGTQINIIS